MLCVTQANIAEVEVAIPARLHNALIGTKGRLIRSIMEECGGVHIHFPVEGSGSDTVVIRGPSSDVEKARKQLLHLAEEKVSTAGRAVVHLLLPQGLSGPGAHGLGLENPPLGLSLGLFPRMCRRSWQGAGRCGEHASV